MRYCLVPLRYQIAPRRVERSFVTYNYLEWLFLNQRGDTFGSAHGAVISLDNEISLARIHLLSHGQNLQFIPRIFEENQIMTLKTGASTIFP